MENHTTDRTRDAVLSDVETIKRTTVQLAQDVKDHATAQLDEKKKKVSDAIETIRESVSAHPFALLGFGLFVGYVLGLRRRRR